MANGRGRGDQRQIRAADVRGLAASGREMSRGVSMTTEEFYAALEQKTSESAPGWYVTAGGCLRYRPLGNDRLFGIHCPLSFVAGTTPCDAIMAGQSLGISVDDACLIADVADSKESCHPKMRERLLEACGGLEG